MWYIIPDTNNAYSINESGQVKSNERLGYDGRFVKEKILKPALNNSGYLVVDLRINGKTKKFLVHVLVAKTLLLNYDCKKDVNHKDGNKINNNILNLECISRSENIKHAFNMGLRKISDREKKEIGERFRKINSKPIKQLSIEGIVISEFSSCQEVNNKLGFLASAVAKAANGKVKTSYGYKWEWIK